MERKFAIIGTGIEKATIERLMEKEGLNDIVIVTPEEAKNISATNIFDDPDNTMDIRYIDMEFKKPPEINLWPDKPFICKGKHRYIPVEKRDGNIINL